MEVQRVPDAAGDAALTVTAEREDGLAVTFTVPATLSRGDALEQGTFEDESGLARALDAELVAADMTCQASGGKRLLVGEFRFCDDADVEREQERELRQWAIALSGAAEPERRAMSRAILMLLKQVDSLQAELQGRSSAPEPNPIASAVEGAATREVDADATPVEDTVLGLRDRFRAATQRGRD